MHTLRLVVHAVASRSLPCPHPHPRPRPRPRPRPNPRPNPRLAQRRALRSEDKADAFFRHVQNRHVLAAFEVGVHHCRRATTGALLQRDLDAQSREIDLFGKANQLHLGESESEGEGARVRARVEGEDKGEREGEREGEGRVLRVKARVGVRVGWQ